MNKIKTFASFFVVLFLIPAGCRSQSDRVDRQPAVAGQFYPAKTEDLRTTLTSLFSSAVPSKGIKDVVAVIAPHAGYVFSGEVAASAFSQVDASKQYDNVFVLASSHQVAFEGASIYTKGDFITPLGTVKVNMELGDQLIKKNKFFSNRSDAHASEHSIEVQLPFLQYRLKKEFRIVPIVLGTNDPAVCKQIADALLPYFNSRNLFVVSSDFSHYPSYKDAAAVDRATADAILSNKAGNLIHAIEGNSAKGIPNLATSLCGWTSVLTLLGMTEKNPSVAMDLIQYKNSGDSQYGDRNQVVGYCAIAVSLKEGTEKREFNLNVKDKKNLLAIARSTVASYVRSQPVPSVETTGLSEQMRTNCGAFVSLYKNSLLRGCIGRFDASEPLFKVVQEMAIASATQDYRFTPVGPDEVDKLTIEISVLTPMRKIASIDEIELGKHGIYIKKGSNAGTFLPQVATETGWSKEEFLGYCAQDKAGIGWNGWRDAEIYVYEALVFSEKELAGK